MDFSTTFILVVSFLCILPGAIALYLYDSQRKKETTSVQVDVERSPTFQSELVLRTAVNNLNTSYPMLVSLPSGTADMFKVFDGTLGSASLQGRDYAETISPEFTNQSSLVNLECPGCGASLSKIGIVKCDHCGRTFFIS